MCRREWLCLLLSHAADFRDGRRVSQPGLAATDDPGRTMAVISRVNRVPRRQRTVSLSVVMLLMAGIAAVASRVGFEESPPPPAPLLLMLATASAPATPLPPVPAPTGRPATGLVSRIPGSTTSAPVVALTFDDGPDPASTLRILDLLAAGHATATFFVVGRQAQRFPDLVRAEVGEGSAVEGHTWTHRRLPGLDEAAFSAEVDRSDDLLAQLVGHRVTCVRPPYGRVDARVVERLGSRGLTTALWDVDPRDWSRPGAGTIAARVLGRLHPGAVIVLHDGGGDRSQTVAALPVILDGIRSRGYVPAPLCA